jgi:hypothetical protein
MRLITYHFAPTARLARVIKLAAHRKVDVRILIPEKSDHFIVDLGARSYFDTLLRSGVRIFLYSGNMIHSKAIVIDGLEPVEFFRQSCLNQYKNYKTLVSAGAAKDLKINATL